MRFGSLGTENSNHLASLCSAEQHVVCIKAGTTEIQLCLRGSRAELCVISIAGCQPFEAVGQGSQLSEAGRKDVRRETSLLFLWCHTKK